MSRILGIGVDVIEVDRIEAAIAQWGDRFLDRIFTDTEREYCQGKARPAESYAARFAAKEAVLKAIGTGWNNQAGFREVEVIRAEGAAPTIVLSPRVRRLLPAGSFRVWLTISHTKSYAVAQALITSESDPVHRFV